MFRRERRGLARGAWELGRPAPWPEAAAQLTWSICARKAWAWNPGWRRGGDPAREPEARPEVTQPPGVSLGTGVW